MSAALYYSDAIAWNAISFTWSRWGGGAHAGRTHVWSSMSPFTAFSTQCVVDDFGTLVPAVQA